MDKYNRRVSREINNWKCGCSSILSNFPASHFRFQQINFVVRKSIAELSSGLNRFHCPLKPNQFVHPTAEEVHYFTKETTPARSNYDERLISMQCTRQFLYLYSLTLCRTNQFAQFLSPTNSTVPSFRTSFCTLHKSITSLLWTNIMIIIAVSISSLRRKWWHEWKYNSHPSKLHI